MSAGDPAGDPLKDYRAKRNFDATPEPAGGAGAGSGPGRGQGAQAVRAQHRFVIQKHWATRLHYDFRLELDGTLKSWAVPKGPSFDPVDKRMAIQVEDHPVDYAEFEGRIPARQYGAGQVVLWDKGAWSPVGDPLADLAAGHLKIDLFGHKLRGRWALVRLKPREDRRDARQVAWLLIKDRDKFARAAGDFSVVDEMPDSVAGLPDVDGASAGASDHGAVQTPIVLSRIAEKAPLPALLAPQLATYVERAPAASQDWQFEIKYDGYRLLARIEDKTVQLFTRNGNDWTDKIRHVERALKSLALPSGWYDGELVVMNDNGLPDFGALQREFERSPSDRFVYYLFDLPYVRGYDLRAVPLSTRRAVLQDLLKDTDDTVVRFSQVIEGAPDHLLASAGELGLEGVIGKRRDAPYRSDRSTAWIKLKCRQRQEFVIGAYTHARGDRRGLGALLLGVHDQHGALIYAGKVGTGFDDTTLTKVKKQLDVVIRDTSPFAPSAAIERGVVWVQPTLVAEVEFADWTRDGHIRHAVFRGLRLDQVPSTIVRERPMPTSQAPAASGTIPAGFKISHPDRVIDAASGATKLDLVRYYAMISPLMLEHLKGRPVSLVRAPDGIAGQLFFQKHLDKAKISGVRQLPAGLFADHDPLLEIRSHLGLLSAAQWNVVEFHTMNTDVKNLALADRLIFDLDPGEGVEWSRVQQVALLTQVMLTELGLVGFLKTSGGKGLHIVVPIRRHYDWDTVKGFCRAVVQHMATTLPKLVIAKSGPRNRVGKVFIDFLRNGTTATTVCAWSARARPGLGVSVPVAWDELEQLKGADLWTVKTAHARLDVGNTPWADYAGSRRSLASAMKALGVTPWICPGFSSRTSCRSAPAAGI